MSAILSKNDEILKRTNLYHPKHFLNSNRVLYFTTSFLLFPYVFFFNTKGFLFKNPLTPPHDIYFYTRKRC